MPSSPASTSAPDHASFREAAHTWTAATTWGSVHAVHCLPAPVYRLLAAVQTALLRHPATQPLLGESSVLLIMHARNKQTSSAELPVVANDSMMVSQSGACKARKVAECQTERRRGAGYVQTWILPQGQ